MPAEEAVAHHHRIAVVESRQFWVSELRRRFRDEPVDVRQVLVANAARELGTSAPRIVVWDTGPHRDVDLDCVRRLAAGLRHGALVVILPVGVDHGAEWLLREVGAATVVDELIGGERLAAICRRYLQCQTGPDVVPAPLPPESVS